MTEGAGAAAFAAIYNHKFEFKPEDKIVTIVSGGNIALRMLSRCIDRALFLKQTRISCRVILPYGSIYYSQFLDILVSSKAEVVSCYVSPQIHTVANKNEYSFIIDIENPEDLNQIRNKCDSNGWLLLVEETSLFNE